MKERTEMSLHLYDILMEKGYPEGFCHEVTCNLNTDWTAERMIGYLNHYEHLSMVDIADEVLAILNDRNRILQKKRYEEVNARWNQYLWEGFGGEPL